MPLLYENKGQCIEFRTTDGVACGPHLHNHVELAIILDGFTYAYADGIGGRIQKGDTFIAFPNQLHYFENDSPDLLCSLLIFPPDIIPEFTSIFKNQVPQNPIIPIDLDRISQTIDLITCERGKPSKFCQQIICGCLQIILSKIFENAELVEANHRDLSTIKSILIYCNTHYNDPLTLDDIAANVHINKYHISHIFNREIGISFTDFINAIRVRKSYDLIKKGEQSITEIAFQVGFSSLRSFNRQFLALSGCTPREYKKRHS